MGWIKRAWRSKGFGVHSPFAFRFITQVIGETLPYYDYLRLPDADSCLLYRLAVKLQPSKIHQLGSGSDAHMARMGCPPKKRVPPTWVDVPYLELAVGSEKVDTDGVIKHLMAGHVCALLGSYDYDKKAAITKFLDQKGYGMIFHNGGNRAIIVPFERLPRQDFEINL